MMPKTLQSWVDDAYQTGILAIDTETTSLTPAKADLVGISIASTVGKAAYIPLGHAQEIDLFGAASDDDTPQMDKAECLEIYSKPLLEDASVIKIGHNMKYDWQMFKKEGIALTPCDDTMLISYVLDGASHSHSMDNLSIMYCDSHPD